MDIKNVLGKENPFYNYFDVRKGEEVILKQLGFIPVVYYKLEF